MHRTPIGIRQLLLRALASGALSPEDRAELRAALEKLGPAASVRDLLFWLPDLCARGVLTPLPPRFTTSELRLRYAIADTFDTLAVPLPARSPSPGVLVLPAELVQLLAPANARTLAALHRLSSAVLGEGGSLLARGEILRAAQEEATRALGELPAYYFPTDAERAAASAYSPPPDLFSFLSPWSTAFDASGRQLVFSPDTSVLPGEECNAAEHGVGSLLGVEVGSKDAGVDGYLEWRSSAPGHFTPELLAQAAHFAAGLADHLSRAARLEGLLYVDRLTGAFNVNHFQTALGGEVARAKRDGTSMALLLADIDDFKRFNTTYGYEAGNEVLAAVGGVLLNGVRPFDSVARWGGEEFAVLLSAPVGRDEAESIAERLRAQVENLSVAVTGLDGERHAVRVSVSMGVALYPGDAADPDLLWRAANKALLEAKRPPKNRVVLAARLRELREQREQREQQEPREPREQRGGRDAPRRGQLPPRPQDS